MELSNKKQQIIRVALDLFSVQGYEATSISQIADAVGVRKASLYSHFSSKQEILDCIIQMTMEEHNKCSIFTNANWNDEAFTKGMDAISSDEIAEMIIGHIKHLYGETMTSKARRLLIIEQYVNSELGRMLTRVNYEEALDYYRGFMKYYVKKGILKDMDLDIMAAQFSLPISGWINLWDREPEREEEITELIKRHVKQFFLVYGNN